MVMAKVSGRVSLKTLLIVPYVLLLVFTVGFTNWYAQRSSSKAIDQATLALRSELTRRVTERVDEYISAPAQLNSINSQAFRSGAIDIHNSQQRDKYFYDLMIHNPTAVMTLVGFPDGSFYGARRMPDNNIEVAERIDGDSYYFLVDSLGNRVYQTKIYSDFDPRTRPWYKSAQESGKAVWSPIYKHFVINDLAITNSLPVYNNQGELMCVFGVDYVFDSINSFMKSLIIGQTGQAFIMEEDFSLVSATMVDSMWVSINNKLERLSAFATDNTLVTKAATYLKAHKQLLPNTSSTAFAEFGSEDDRVLLQVSSLAHGKGLKWYLVLAMPARDFTHNINAAARRGNYIAFASLLLAVVLGLLVIRQLSQPVERLALASRQYAAGNWNYRLETSNLKELSELSSTFNLMAANLQELFTSLEDKVQERTEELRSANKDLEANKAFLTSVIESLTHPFMVIDTQTYNVIMGNKASGWKPSSNITCHLLSHGMDIPCQSQEHPCPVTQVLKTGKPSIVEHLHIGPKGDWRYVEVHGYPIVNSQGKIDKIIEYSLDITDRKLAQQELLTSQQELAKSNAAKNKLFSIIAHDLRGPLGNIIEVLNVMDAGLLDAELTQKLISELRSSAVNTSELLNNLLLWARSQSRALELTPDKINLHELIVANISLATPMALRKGITLRKNIKGRLYAWADKNTINTVIRNLINNAIKFTRSGGTIEVGTTVNSQNAVVWIEDTGVGMSPKKLDEIFKIDVKTSTKGTANETGTGLGLVLCKEFVEKNNGNLNVSSVQGLGSKFWFDLPVSQPAAEPEEE